MRYAEYYYNYYNLKKHIYRERYYQKKRQAKENEELYRPYGGEANFYRQKILEFLKQGNDHEQQFDEQEKEVVIDQK